jgi:hypothetical protein
VVCVWSFCSLNKFAKVFASAIKKNKFITKTKALAWWGFGSFAFQIRPRPLLVTL